MGIQIWQSYDTINSDYPVSVSYLLSFSIVLDDPIENGIIQIYNVMCYIYVI